MPSIHSPSPSQRRGREKERKRALQYYGEEKKKMVDYTPFPYGGKKRKGRILFRTSFLCEAMKTTCFQSGPPPLIHIFLAKKKGHSLIFSSRQQGKASSASSIPWHLAALIFSRKRKRGKGRFYKSCKSQRFSPTCEGGGGGKGRGVPPVPGGRARPPLRLLSPPLARRKGEEKKRGGRYFPSTTFR